MGDISTYFNASEMQCHCCGKIIVNDELMKVLDRAREHFNQPITITSGTRCEKHNQECGGAPKSQHVLGLAADIQVKNHKPAEVAQYFEKLYPDKYGVGRYNGWTHIDVRPMKARWDLAT